MGGPEFEWDESRDAENQRKHGVAFEEAKAVFLDARARSMEGQVRRDTLDVARGIRVL